MNCLAHAASLVVQPISAALLADNVASDSAESM